MPRPDPPPYGCPLHAPLDYVPTAPVYKPRRALRRSIKAAATAFALLAVAFFAPIAIAALAALGVFIIGLSKLEDWASRDE